MGGGGGGRSRTWAAFILKKSECDIRTRLDTGVRGAFEGACLLDVIERSCTLLSDCWCDRRRVERRPEVERARGSEVTRNSY